MKAVTVGALVFASCFCAANTSLAATLPFTISPTHPVWEIWLEKLENGNTKLRNGDYIGAYEEFSAAEEMKFSPIATFLTWIGLAEVLCKLGERERALDYLLDYEEAAKLIINKDHCFLSVTDYENNIYNPSIRPRTAKLLCPEEVFLESGPTLSRESDIAAAAQMLTEAQRIRKICEASIADHQER